MVAIDPDEGLLVVRNKNGKRQTLDMANVVDRHIRPGWVQTIHAAQGATSDKVMAHLESFRSNVEVRIAYVAVSRAKTHAVIYTDDHPALVHAIEGRDGANVGVIDEILRPSLGRRARRSRSPSPRPSGPWGSRSENKYAA